MVNKCTGSLPESSVLSMHCGVCFAFWLGWVGCDKSFGDNVWTLEMHENFPICRNGPYVGRKCDGLPASPGAEQHKLQPGNGGLCKQQANGIWPPVRIVLADPGRGSLPNLLVEDGILANIRCFVIADGFLVVHNV